MRRGSRTLARSWLNTSGHDEGHGGGHEFHRNHAALFVGGMGSVPGNDVAPAVGLSYERRFNPRWGAEALVDATFGDYKRTLLVACGVTFRVGDSLKFMAGPGFEVAEKEGSKKKKVHFLMGVGAAYEFHLPNGFSIAPTVYVDFLGDTKTNITVGLGFGKGF